MPKTNEVLQVTLDTLSRIDGGRVGILFDRHMQRAVGDCLDRPGDKSVREVTVKLLVTPDPSDEDDASGVDIQCKVATKVPPHVSRTINCAVKAGARAVFNDLTQGSHRDQRPLVYGEDDDE